MPAASPKPVDITQSLCDSFRVNEKINQELLETLDAGAWRAEPPTGKGRNIADIFAHIHNVRIMWLEAAAKGSEIPHKLDRLTCTPDQVAAALARSAQACSALIASALATPEARVKNFRPDGVHFVAYLLSHEAHHRGQICMLARQAGYPLSKQAGFAMWEWGTLAKSLS